MDYEKEYKGALDRAKKLYEQGTITESLSYVFPELKESEEEKIVRCLLNYFHHVRYNGLDLKDTNVDKVIAWLEKQGQVNETIISQHENKTCKENNDSLTSEEAIQYLKENHSPSEVSDFQATMNIAVAKAYDKGVKDGLENKGQTFTKKEVDDAYLAGVRDAKKELKKISQRIISAEVKEAMYGKPTAWSEEDEKMCQETIDWFEKKCFPYALENENPARKSIKWLKSLKQRIGG